MIKNYGDHAANERTFLAWVRTAVAVVAFGFIVEKFDLFLQLAAPALAGRTLSIPGQKFGNVVGLSLIVVTPPWSPSPPCASSRRRSTSTALKPTPARVRGSIWRLRPCSSSWDVLYSSTLHMLLSLRSNSAPLG
jgi:hypothetical protein